MSSEVNFKKRQNEDIAQIKTPCEIEQFDLQDEVFPNEEILKNPEVKTPLSKPQVLEQQLKDFECDDKTDQLYLELCGIGNLE
jgi:hypothetical protein